MVLSAVFSKKRFALIALGIFVPLAALFVLLEWHAVTSQQHLVESILHSKSQGLLHAKELRIGEHLRTTLKDVMFLAQAPPTRGYANTQNRELLRETGRLFKEFGRAKGVYDQIRLLDLRGKEIVRVNNIGGEPALVTEDQLQDKGHRKYFQQSMALPENGVYLSRIELNMEHGAIERPYKPVLRMAVPVTDDSGERKGVLIVNLLANLLLRSTLPMEEAGLTPYGVTIIDDDGYLLKGEFPGDEWGRQIPSRRDRIYANLHPEAWRAMEDEESGSFVLDEGMFTHQRFSPLAHSDEHPDHRLSGPGTAPLRLVAFIPGRKLERYVAELHEPTLLAAGASLLALAALSLTVAHALERRRGATLAMETKNQDLKTALGALETAMANGRRTERTLQEANKYFQDVLDAASEVAIISTDPRGTITLFNKGAEQMLGLDAEAMVGKATPMAFHDPDEIAERKHELERQLTRTLADLEVFNLLPDRKGSETREWTYIHKDGSRLSVSLVVTAIRDAAGSITGYLGVATDISEERQAKQRLEAVMSAAPDAIITLDDRGTILTGNLMAGRLFGIPLKELEGTSVQQLMPAPYDKVMAPLLYSTDDGQEAALAREFPGQRNDGSVFPMEASVGNAQLEEKAVRVVVLRDISRRKQAEEALIRTKNLLERQQAALDGELRAAARLQKKLMPSGRPQYDGVSVAWRYEPSMLVGGDVFHIQQQDDTALDLFMIDVAGHGMSAGLLGATVMQAMRPGGGVASRHKADGEVVPYPPAHTLSLLNAEFPLERFDSYFSMILCRLDTTSGDLTYAGAGHPSPVVLRAADGAVEELDYADPVIGVRDDHDYRQFSAHLAPGDILLLYTDGCTEYHAPDGELFGTEGLLAALAKCRGYTAEDALESLWHDMKRHGGSTTPDDDLTLLVLRYEG